MFGVLLSLPHAYYCMFYLKKNFRIFLVGFWAWKPKNNIRFPAQEEHFSLLQSFHTGSGGPQSFLFNGNQGHFSLGKAVRDVKLASCCRLLVPRLRTKGVKPPIPNTPLWFT